MAQASDRTIQEIRAMIDEWVAAELAGDAPALDRLLADDFVGVGPLGFVLTKPQWLARYTEGALKYDAFALNEARIRAYGDAAVAVGRQSQGGTYQGDQPLPPGGRATLVFARQDGRWRLAGWHLSPISGGAGQ